ncbi:MAG: MotA/TolQ/ExbB proton channel family protein [Cytophagales bacterium]|nr:MotA/TolQ/ExbB proton channel family protein [Cytophagales bacterium]
MKNAFTVALAFLSIEVSVAAPTERSTTRSETVQVSETDNANTLLGSEITAPKDTVTAIAPEGEALEEAMERPNFHQVIKEKFIEGGWQFMTALLICLIVGLTIVIERIIILNLATVNTDRLLLKVEEALTHESLEVAQEVCKNTRGPVASLFTQGLIRMPEGIDMVEKSIIAYGSVEMSKLEKGLVWISLFISLAPMLGFMGTVVGMIQAFDAIEAAGDISPSLVAGGIKVALITTVGGLIVAVILQVFYNYLVAKIDAIVTDMEDASIAFVDLLVKHKLAG